MSVLPCVSVKKTVIYTPGLTDGDQVILIRKGVHTPAEYLGKTVWGDEAFYTDEVEYINWESDVEYGDLVIVHAPKEEA